MTGAQFEIWFCKFLQERGYWALNIPRAKTGAQPFDVIAMRGQLVLMIDCKVISVKNTRFPLERVEDNQWLAMGVCSEKTVARCFFAVYHVQTHQMFLLPFTVLEDAKKKDAASVELKPEYLAYKVLSRLEKNYA